MINVWIVGAEGRVGSALLSLLDCKQYKIMKTDLKEVDITDLEAVQSYMLISRPDVIVNCAGYTDTDACEANPDDAYRVNAIGARNLAHTAETYGAKIIHISTDDVFGQRPAAQMRKYNEFDTPSPQSVYGKSKYAGEQMIMQCSTRFVILRSSWIYGTGADFVSKVLRAAKGDDISLEVPVNEFAAPTSAFELAKVVAEFIDTEKCGVYHAVCTGYCSRFQFAQKILELAGKSGDLKLIPQHETDGVRPVYSVLDNMMLRLDGVEEPADWEKALEDYFEHEGGKLV